MGIRGSSRGAGIIAYLLFFGFFAQGQETLYPGLAGESLADAIRNEFTPPVVLTYTQAKDTLYARIFVYNDSVRCIYSGLARQIPNGVDPSQWLYGTGAEAFSMNLEHAWPQAKGAGDGTMGNRDLHHLFPARAQINSTRGNLPYADIPDNQTTLWFYQDNEYSSKPLVAVDAYSEFASGRFEPRESVKGDIARAMFYFWTIYREDALAADPDFFEQQRETFIAWHLADPVDAEELARTHRIANYEGGVANPFVLDCSLAERAYSPDEPSCLISAVRQTPELQDILRYDAEAHALHLIDASEAAWRLMVFDLTGRPIRQCVILGGDVCSLDDMIPGAYLAVAAGPKGTTRLVFIVR